MTADELTKIEAAYHGARDRRGNERSRYLDEVCGSDTVMRRQIERLLHQDENAHSLLDRPAIELALALDSVRNEPAFSGTRIGVYEVLECIGSGGMGEVYRARDTRLHREVAIKFLPIHLARDPDRLSRLRREAQTLAALSHPNVAQVYGLEESGTTSAIAMELVDGETLAQRIRRGPIGLTDALRIAKDIAEALEAAHEKGVVHRDLKPANVKITPQGQVKVLDFGLAKAVRCSDPERAAYVSAENNQATADGMILGTPAYMSPEQATGASTDHRADVFAFGCVLYELLTGERAFDGGPTSMGSPSVLTIEPDLSKLSPAISPRLRTLIARCLERDLRHRWQAIGDVRIELETIQADPRSLVGDVVRDPLSRRAIPLVATAMLVGVFVAAVTRARPEQSQPQTTRFSLPLAPGQRFTEHGRHIIAVSPDGSRIAFVANDRLIVREMADANLEQLPVSNWDLGTPLFSPDGRWIAFFADRRLQKVAVTGGAPVVICEMLNPFGASWGEDDYILVGQGPGGIQRVSASGGKPETVVTVKPGEVAHGPQMLPDGEHLLFTLATGGTGSERWDRAQIVVQSLRSGERKVVIRDGSDARYVGSSGRIIYAYGATLRAIPFDLKRLEVTGDPEPIVDGVRRASVDSATGAAQFGLSATGTLAYILGGVPPTHRTVALIDMSGRATVLDTLPGLNYTPRFSADGRQIAWQGGDGNIWIYDRGGTNAKRKLTFDGTSRAPVWSPDARIVFQSGRGGDGGLFWQRADGSAPAERLTNFEPGFVDIPTSVSTDGKTLLFLRRRDSVRADAAPSAEPEGVYVLALEGSRTARVLIEASNDDASYGAPAFSPDGRWIVYQRGGVPFVEPFPSTGARYQITSERSWAPMWSPDGGRVVYLTGPNRRRFVAVDVFRKEPSFEHGPPMLLFEVQEPVNTFGEGGRIADMSPDGKYIVAIQDWLERDAEPGPSRIDVVLNWLEELKQRVPTR